MNAINVIDVICSCKTVSLAVRHTVQLRCKVNGARELLASHTRVARKSRASCPRVALESHANYSRYH